MPRRLLPRILVFSEDAYSFDRLFVELQVLVPEITDGEFLHAAAPRPGLDLLEKETGIGIVVAFQCRCPEDPGFHKLRLIQEIACRVRDRQPVVTVGPFESHHLLRHGATHECTARRLPDLLAVLYERRRLEPLFLRLAKRQR